jgi:hypothetical protein
MPETVTLYHGSRFVIQTPTYGEGNPRNDYGLGFYCTQAIELAKEWACTDEDSGYANQYEIETTGLSVMHLSGPEYNILNWMAILLNNRNIRISNDVAAEGRSFLLNAFLPDTQRYDIVSGYRANDSYFSFANAFINNTLSLAQLEKAMYLGKLGEQTMLKSKAAFDRIQFIRSEFADRVVFYPMKSARDQEARAAYRRERASQRVAESVYLMDILREGWENDDARLRRNIPG